MMELSYLNCALIRLLFSNDKVLRSLSFPFSEQADLFLLLAVSLSQAIFYDLLDPAVAEPVRTLPGRTALLFVTMLAITAQISTYRFIERQFSDVFVFADLRHDIFMHLHPDRSSL